MIYIFILVAFLLGLFIGYLLFRTNNSSLKKLDDALIKSNKDKSLSNIHLLGGGIPMDLAMLLEEGGYTERQQLILPSRRVGRDYLLERSVYFSRAEVEEWAKRVKRDYNLSDKIGYKIFFAKYPGNYDNPTAYQNRSTVIIRAITVDSAGNHTNVSYEDGKEHVCYNLGNLCPPGCDASNSGIE